MENIIISMLVNAQKLLRSMGFKRLTLISTHIDPIVGPQVVVNIVFEENGNTGNRLDLALLIHSVVLTWTSNDGVVAITDDMCLS
jgi:hypothetical protein